MRSPGKSRTPEVTDPEDDEVEAILAATLNEIADANPAELVELQRLIECYLLRAQLAYPAASQQSDDSAEASADAVQEVTQMVIPPRQVRYCLARLQHCNANLS